MSSSTTDQFEALKLTLFTLSINFADIAQRKPTLHSSSLTSSSQSSPYHKKLHHKLTKHRFQLHSPVDARHGTIRSKQPVHKVLSRQLVHTFLQQVSSERSPHQNAHGTAGTTCWDQPAARLRTSASRLSSMLHPKPENLHFGLGSHCHQRLGQQVPARYMHSCPQQLFVHDSFVPRRIATVQELFLACEHLFRTISRRTVHDFVRSVAAHYHSCCTYRNARRAL